MPPEQRRAPPGDAIAGLGGADLSGVMSPLVRGAADDQNENNVVYDVTAR